MRGDFSHDLGYDPVLSCNCYDTYRLWRDEEHTLAHIPHPIGFLITDRSMLLEVAE
jgi:hypothetical protein